MSSGWGGKKVAFGTRIGWDFSLSIALASVRINIAWLTWVSPAPCIRIVASETSSRRLHTSLVTVHSCDVSLRAFWGCCRKFLLPQAGSSSVTVMRLPPPRSTVVSVLLGGYNAGSLSSTGSLEPGGDKTADPASTLVELVLFSPVVLIVQLDHAGRGAGVWCVCARVPVRTNKKERKEPKNQKNREQKKKNAEKKGPRVGLNPSYQIPVPTKRRRAIPSGHSDMAVLL